ncbi:MAG TPA: hypothetical protein VK034_14975 [Enhygromyxa sp.]|nr:hypothetical protein [Enhygromyxa sp.]
MPTLLGCCAIACAAPPGVEGRPGAGAIEQPDEAEPEAEAELEAPEGDDPLLAEARGRVRGGRVPAALRRRLVESDSPDHRHAARLLQAIAGEPPAAVLARTGGRGSVEVEPMVDLAAPELFEAAPESPSEPESPELSERPPKLSSFVTGSPAWRWFATGLVVVEPEPEPAEVDPDIGLETIVGSLPLLLRERPPIPEDSTIGDGPRLVILTSLSLRSGSSRDVATLELAGAGAVKVGVQPLASGRLRLFVLHAGAVPGFLAARPSAAGVEVVDVARRDRQLEIEVELARGWTLRNVTSLGNGASVEFARER